MSDQVWAQHATDRDALNYDGIEPVWYTHDGEEIPLSHISDRHLQNIERFLRGAGDLRVNHRSRRVPHWRSVILSEMVRRGLDAL